MMCEMKAKVLQPGKNAGVDRPALGNAFQALLQILHKTLLAKCLITNPLENHPISFNPMGWISILSSILLQERNNQRKRDDI